MPKSYKDYVAPYKNLDDTREYYDPHPGVAGALAPSPLPLRMAAHELAGKKMPLAAVKKLFEDILSSTRGGTVDVLQESIVVSSGAHCWRMLRHRAA